ncbi:MAG: mechanosensitive ion channel family protein [Chloroflexi bacterium]|nr:mechanosensitive ion channel family protein [Chloroflexota bacterium]
MEVTFFDFLGLDRHHAGEVVLAALILVLGLILAWVLSCLTDRVVRLLGRSADAEFNQAIAREVRFPIVAMVIVQSVFSAVLPLSHVDPVRDVLERAWGAVTLFVVVVIVWRAVGATFTWWEHRVGEEHSSFSSSTLPVLRRSVRVVVALVGMLVVLDSVGVAVGPLLAGLGIGGIAVALAAQPILANVFAGFYMLSDRSIAVGDFIELDGGPNGWVEDIGLRATQVRTFDNNLVLIPNSTLANATVTNFDSNAPPSGARVVCGIAYEEDLTRVEAVVVEELLGVIETVPEVDPEYEPYVRFTTFGESNVDFLMRLRSRDRRDVALVQHEMIKRVHARFAVEDITINYPARRLFVNEDDTGGLARLAGRVTRRPGR